MAEFSWYGLNTGPICWMHFSETALLNLNLLVQLAEKFYVRIPLTKGRIEVVARFRTSC